MADAQALLQLMVLVNYLQLKAFNAPNKETLAFIIVNDTHKVFKYERAILWEMEGGRPKQLAISGHHTIYKETEFAQKSRRLLSHLKEPEGPQVLTENSFAEEGSLWKEIYPKGERLIYWVPIKSGEELKLGLWLELLPHDKDAHRNMQEELHFLSHNLAPGYAAAWAKFDTGAFWKKWKTRRELWFYGLLTAAILLFAVRMPLRVAAPCEVVPADPVVVTAPLDGIIEKVVVEPGQAVKLGELLFFYDKRVAEQELKTAENQVEIARAELRRASTLGLSDLKSLAEVEVLKLKLKKEEIALALAEAQTEKLDVEAPTPGVVMIDDPEEWQGRPVKVGERVLSLSNPEKTKLRIWIPEGDNVEIDKTIPVLINLHVAPEREYLANLVYISFESELGEGEVPAYRAEANWETPPEEVKLGLKGTAILYGENVSLFYFLVRKPWSTFRRVTGI